MNIGFNLLDIGLGNNGGTRTLLKCTNTLNSIGHSAVMLARSDNFTWFDHEKPLASIPNDLDAIIAASCHDINSTFTSGIRKKAWYIRAHETWLTTEDTLISLYKINNIKNLVNSKALQIKLKEFDVESSVIYQGIDFDLWKNKKLRDIDKIRIGCLYTTQPRKRWKDFVKLASLLGNDDYEYVGIGNSKPKEDFLTHFACNVDSNELCDVYSSCHIWFAPTDSEGLHNVPMEANLCGCLVVCSDEPLNGMVYDYAFDHTAMIYKSKDIEHAAYNIKNADFSLVKNMQLYLKEYIGNRETNMKKLVNILEDL